MKVIICSHNEINTSNKLDIFDMLSGPFKQTRAPVIETELRAVPYACMENSPFE